jgi:hypothetical protein
VRKAALVHDHVRATELMLTAASQEGGAVPEPAILNLSTISSDLARITDEFEAMFAQEFEAVSVPAPEATGNRVVQAPELGAPFGPVGSGRWTDSGTNPGTQARHHAKSIDNRGVA